NAAPLAPSDEWTPVTLHGSYCADDDCVLYVRNRQLSGRVGFWQLAPFRTEDGTTILVVRGWVPSGGEDSQPADPAPVPEGDRTVTVRLRPAEPVLDREPPPGQTHSVNPGQSAGLMGLEDPDLVTGAYGELVSEEPSAERPAALPSPDTSLGPHLSYAFQWWVFALFFPGALIYRTRRQFQDLAADRRRAGAPAPHPRPSPPPRGPQPAPGQGRGGRGCPHRRAAALNGDGRCPPGSCPVRDRAASPTAGSPPTGPRTPCAPSRTRCGPAPTCSRPTPAPPVTGSRSRSTTRTSGASPTIRAASTSSAPTRPGQSGWPATN